MSREISRREIMKQGAGALAASVALPASLSAGAAQNPPQDPAAAPPSKEIPTATVTVPPDEQVGAQDTLASFRADYGFWHGEVNFRLNWNIIHKTSRVFCSVAEDHLGAARCVLYNVTPDEGFAVARADIQWGSNLHVLVSFVVLN